MVATPFLYDSFIHYSTPVYPDAIQPEGLPHDSVQGFSNGGAGIQNYTTAFSITAGASPFMAR
jgi:hypothetical protein